MPYQKYYSPSRNMQGFRIDQQPGRAIALDVYCQVTELWERKIEREGKGRGGRKVRGRRRGRDAETDRDCVCVTLRGGKS